MNAVITLKIGNKNIPLWELCMKTQREYCVKYGIDYHVIDTIPDYLDIPDLNEQRKICLCKLEVFNFFRKYDRILFLDADVMVSPKAPNIFEYYTDNINRAYRITDKNICDIVNGKYKDVSWPKIDGINAYYNGGVWLLNKYDYKYNIAEYENIGCGDEAYLLYIMLKNNIPFADLDFRYNTMYNHGCNKYASYFLHYAGHGWSNITDKTKRYEMELDKYRIAVKDNEFLEFLK